MPIEIGINSTAETVVSDENLAVTIGSGDLRVFATPMMIALMEQAAATCIALHLGPGQSSVGTKVDVNHIAASVSGVKITATATVTAIDRRCVDFEVTASDGAGEIGRGTHTRFIVDADKFMQKAQAKA